MENIEWVFFDVGSTLVDEGKAYEERLKSVAQMANVSYEYVYQTALAFYKENKKGDLEIIKLLNVKRPEWRHDYEGAWDENDLDKTGIWKILEEIIRTRTGGL